MFETPPSSFGPHLLSQLEYEIYLIIERRPRPTDLEDLRSAALRGERQGPAAPDEAAREPESRPAAERATRHLERLGYIERVSRAEAGELFRLTPWGKAALVAFRRESGWQLDEWERRWRKRGRRRPQRSDIEIELLPWEIAPSFDELDLDYLDLPTRALHALQNCEIEIIGELTAMTAEELLDVRNIGPKGLAAIEVQLGSLALELAEKEAAQAHRVALGPPFLMGDLWE